MKHTLWSLSRRYLSTHKFLFMAALMCGVIYGLMSGFGLPVIFEKVFRQIFEDTENSYTCGQILWIAGLIPVGFFIRGIFGYLSTYGMNRCGLEILNHLRADIFAKLQAMPLSFFEQKHSGDLVNRVVNDPKTIQDVLLEIASEFFKQPLQMLAAFVGLIYLSIKNGDFVLLTVFLLTLPVCFVPVRLLRYRVKESSRCMQRAEAEVTECVVENLRAAQEIRTFLLEKSALDKAKGVMYRLANRIQTVVQWQKLQQPLMEIVTAVILAIIFIYAYYGHIPFSVFSSMGTALYFAFDPIKKMSNTLGQVHRSTGALERIVEILEMPMEIQSPGKDAYANAIKGEFTFQGVDFIYERLMDATKALQGINLTFSAGKWSALVGPSGAGKSTLIKLLPRLYDVSGGCILLDGIDLRRWSLENLRSQIAVVSQNPVLFNDTIANNLKLGCPEADDAAVIEAAKAAYAHEFILAAGGYHAWVGENGNRFSGGQRQRLAIARAFLKNAPVLILDEATSALDSESEFYIRKAIDRLTVGKTVIAIAHRISTIQNAHCIYLFDGGRFICQGTHAALLKTSESYRQLVEKQLLDTESEEGVCALEVAL
ncbi:MAG: ABC transporter ATP-binding protein/permease [Puniceicoccales bacterium]|nr:ABC transporter ATP-binding protein/permease [Puniceicoccales bacterium]